MPNAMPVLNLETDRLLIGPFHAGDRDAFTAYRNHPEVARYQAWESFSQSQAEELIRSMQASHPKILDDWFQFAIRLKGNGMLIGDIGLRRRANGPSFEADIGYTLAPLHQKQGYMREALTALMAWARQYLEVRRFVASLDPRNEASVRVLQALHFVKEAHHRQNYWFKGAWADDVVYAHLPA